MPVKTKKKAVNKVSAQGANNFLHTAFAHEYLKDFNATQAYYRAGYKASNDKIANAGASRLLRNGNVVAIIRDVSAKRLEKYDVSPQSILDELAKMAFGNIQDFYDEHGKLKQIHDLSRHVAAALQSVEVNLTEACAVQKVKMWSKPACLEAIGRHLKMFSDSTPLNDKLTAGILRKVQSGELALIDGCYELQIAGLPIPDVMKIQLVKNPVEPDQSGEFCPLSDEEFEKRARERLAEVNRQREVFLPERRAEVAEIKELLKDHDSFAPDRFEG